MMYKIQTLNNISDVIHQSLTAERYLIAKEEPVPDGILVRSASMHDMDLPDSLLAIARAGAGTNNIPIDECTRRGIVVFNTPGANANAVAELVICGLMPVSYTHLDVYKRQGIAKAVAQVHPERHTVHIATGAAPVPGVLIGPHAPAPVQHRRSRLGVKPAGFPVKYHLARCAQAVDLLVVVKGARMSGKGRGNHHAVPRRAGERHTRGQGLVLPEVIHPYDQLPAHAVIVKAQGISGALHGDTIGVLTYSSY